MERLDLGLNNGWVSFRARFIKNKNKNFCCCFDFTGRRITRKLLRGPNACVSLEQPIIQLQTFVSLPTKKIQRANSKLTISKLAQALERALGRARSQCFRDNEKLKKINERRRKDILHALTIKLTRGDAPGSSVPLATHSATTEEAIGIIPTHTCQPREKFWRDKRGATERSEPTSEGGPGGAPPENFKNLHCKWCNLCYS